ncbi:TetR/AcrR family transcriptional regulator C-terminal domain-containing protein [Streptomyces bambusae]|uniref:TetR family transcriptional regulator n=1 Tax=Streptomyces bambusae TaxID=1550616 RepID=A0ABS6Z0H0_9ACTN|nr:TetR/AcrR family transcriptional regulator C-terminal domain-containing protein [Streptomyces bambusae]MBW5481217.1 TetR family transcriptional regulator [Streptomyces bambusae]
MIDAAMTLVDEAGLDELTTRRLAERLGLRVGAIYWHVKNKDELLAELADRIVGEALTEPLPDMGASDQLAVTAKALRRAMLDHRDGARLVAGYAVPGPNSLALADRLIGIARTAGVPLPLAAHACDALLSYTTGFVLQEQQQPRGGAASGRGQDLDLSGLPHLAELLAAGIPDREAAFGAGLQLITAGVIAR